VVQPATSHGTRGAYHRGLGRPVGFYVVERQSTSIRMPQQSAAGAGHGHGHGDAPSAKIAKAALDQGDADTQAGLGMHYWHGVDGLPQDDAKAAALYQQAADQGHAGGQVGLGYCYCWPGSRCLSAVGVDARRRALAVSKVSEVHGVNTRRGVGRLRTRYERAADRFNGLWE
jgi:TPR repeat protein